MSSSKLAVTGVVLFYLIAALSMVIANKWVLNATPATPLFFLLTQLILASILFILFSLTRIIPTLTLSITTTKSLFPLISLNLLSLISSTSTLQHVDASFYQVARGLLLPFTVLTSLAFLNTRPSFLVIASVNVVTVGFFIGVVLDGTPISFRGVAWGVLSSLLTSVHSVFIKRSLGAPGIGGSTLLLGWYTNLWGSILLVPVVILVGEGRGVVDLFFGHQDTLRTFMWGSLITGTLGFLMCLSSLLSIKVTSPVTHMVSSAVRGVAGSLLGVWVFGDVITFGRGTSIGTILFGSIMYTWVKHKEQEKPKDSQTSSSPAAKNKYDYQRLSQDDNRRDEDIELGEREQEKR